MQDKLDIVNSKIIVLCVLNISNKSLSLDEIVFLCSDFENVTYFKICSYLDELKLSKYIDEFYDENTKMYKINEKGKSALNELLDLIPGLDVLNFKKLLEKSLTKNKVDFHKGVIVTPIKNDEFRVTCYIKENNKELFSTSLYVTGIDNVRNITKKFEENYIDIYNNILNIMT
ncbi:MAG: DUF4364 family protein [Clostridia bacterium]